MNNTSVYAFPQTSFNGAWMMETVLPHKFDLDVCMLFVLCNVSRELFCFICGLFWHREISSKQPWKLPHSLHNSSDYTLLVNKTWFQLIFFLRKIYGHTPRHPQLLQIFYLNPPLAGETKNLKVRGLENTLDQSALVPQLKNILQTIFHNWMHYVAVTPPRQNWFSLCIRQFTTKYLQCYHLFLHNIPFQVLSLMRFIRKFKKYGVLLLR